MTILALMIGLLFALLIYGIMIYNNLIALRNTSSKNWANIDVLLRQRNSEIPKLIDTCRQYMQYEQETLQKIVLARDATMRAVKENNIAALGIAEKDLHDQLMKLFALAESYPELKANASFLQLQNRISDLENALADRRELYNDSVNIYNIKIQQFPDMLIARLFGFQALMLLKFKKEETEDYSVKNHFKTS